MTKELTFVGHKDDDPAISKKRNDDPEDTIRKALIVAQSGACVGCKKAKKRCDGKAVCGRCRKGRLECIRPNAQRSDQGPPPAQEPLELLVNFEDHTTLRTERVEAAPTALAWNNETLTIPIPQRNLLTMSDPGRRATSLQPTNFTTALPSLTDDNTLLSSMGSTYLSRQDVMQHGVEHSSETESNFEDAMYHLPESTADEYGSDHPYFPEKPHEILDQELSKANTNLVPHHSSFGGFSGELL